MSEDPIQSESRYFIHVDLHKMHVSIRWYKTGTGKLHRENGPAIESADGDKSWYLNNRKYRTEIAYNKALKVLKSKNPCSGKIVEIEGKKYKLIEENIMKEHRGHCTN